MNIDLPLNIDIVEIYQAISDSLIMLGCSTLFAILIGIPLGIVLYLTSKHGLLANRLIYFALNSIYYFIGFDDADNFLCGWNFFRGKGCDIAINIWRFSIFCTPD